MYFLICRGLKTQKKNSKSQQNKNKNTERNAKSGNPLEKIDKLAPREKVKKLFDSVMNSKGDITRAQLILTLQNLTQAERGILKSKIGEVVVYFLRTEMSIKLIV